MSFTPRCLTRPTSVLGDSVQPFLIGEGSAPLARLAMVAPAMASESGLSVGRTAWRKRRLEPGQTDSAHPKTPKSQQAGDPEPRFGPKGGFDATAAINLTSTWCNSICLHAPAHRPVAPRNESTPLACTCSFFPHAQTRCRNTHTHNSRRWLTGV